MGRQHETSVAESTDKDRDSADEPGMQPKVRKRTKTGCITCRKRRIKCGEERPSCNNCTKSKRECGGYQQRVVFRPPHGNGPPVVPAQDDGLSRGQFLMQYPPHYLYNTPNGSDSLQNIAPQPYHGAPGLQYEPHMGYPPGVGQPYVDPLHAVAGQYSLGPSSAPQHWRTSIEPSQHPPTPAYRHAEGFGMGLAAPPYAMSGPPAPHYTGDPNQSFAQPQYAQPQIYGNWNPQQPPYAHYNRQDQDVAATENVHLIQGTRGDVDTQVAAVKQEAVATGDDRRYSSHGFVLRPSFESSVPTLSNPRLHPLDSSSGANLQGDDDEDEDEDEDDPWDMEEENTTESRQASAHAQQDFSRMLFRHAAHIESRGRTFRTFLDGPHVLAKYHPSHVASPLTDDRVGRIFSHFIAVTGPCISVFERKAANSSMTIGRVRVPPSSRTLWTYTLPCIALHHPALLHAMLAVSSLHIARLQETSEGPAEKHLMYALRRVAKLIGLPGRRHEAGTLATNLLIGFYAVMIVDHSRWHLHLAGAKILVMEVDFAGMTRTVKRMRDEAKSRIHQTAPISYEDWVQAAGIPESLLDDTDWEIDEDLVSELSGYRIRYREQGSETTYYRPSSHDFGEKDIDDYKIKMDLFWWYCKQDIAQGMLSGDPLLMPYQHWINCPPRGQIGKADAAYATFDYLCLILGRLVDFAGKDLPRKVSAVAAAGGEWKPPPGFFGPGNDRSRASKTGPNPMKSGSSRFCGAPGDHPEEPPSSTSRKSSTTSYRHDESARSSHPQQYSGGPPMYGMLPPVPGPPNLHSAVRAMYANTHDPAFHTDAPRAESKSMADLEHDTHAALSEHAAIVRAFDLFASRLGDDFQSIPPELSPQISTPFGPALQYKSYPIACIWAFYYVGRILIHRLHPHMPPASMVATGVTMHQTKDYAEKVGKICAGLYYPQSYNLQIGHVNPALGAALMESTFPLMMAAIQFQDAAQRGWTISRLQDIARLTGWQNSTLIAAACEVAWERTGAVGKGPPYTPTLDRAHRDVRVKGLDKTKRPDTPWSLGSGFMGADIKPKMEEEDDEGKLGINVVQHDRKFVYENPATRVHWAAGVLSVEDDLKKLKLQ